ncbi:hypothetical protein GCM10008110_06690 [Marinobacter persicus]|nr:hypothetical protein GCM10008110_06690 [Marinobacter persicus]
MMDGGTICPRVPEAQMVPVARRLSYLWASMTGREIRPMATTLAPTTPVEAASRAPTRIVEMARPPGRPPNSRPMEVSSCSASRVRCSTTPMNMNSGTAINTVFCITLIMR